MTEISIHTSCIKNVFEADVWPLPTLLPPDVLVCGVGEAMRVWGVRFHV